MRRRSGEQFIDSVVSRAEHDVRVYEVLSSGTRCSDGDRCGPEDTHHAVGRLVVRVRSTLLFGPLVGVIERLCSKRTLGKI